MVQLVHDECDVLSQTMSCNQKHQQQLQASFQRGSGFEGRITDKMAGDMHRRERRGEAVQTARDKNQEQDVIPRARAGRYSRTQQVYKNHKVNRQHKERPHIVLQQRWEPQSGEPPKLAPLDIS